jgi:hypothetical protein
MNCDVLLLFLSHVSSVWLSHSAALGAVHGASTGTCVDIWSSCATASAASGATAAGAAPVGSWSLNVVLVPFV